MDALGQAGAFEQLDLGHADAGEPEPAGQGVGELPSVSSAPTSRSAVALMSSTTGSDPVASARIRFLTPAAFR